MIFWYIEGENMKQELKTLWNKLGSLGYPDYSIANMVRYATGKSELQALNRDEAVSVQRLFERYVHLGSAYVANYSK